MREKKKSKSEVELLGTVDTGDMQLDVSARLTALGRIVNKLLKSRMSRLGLNLAQVSLLYLLRLKFDKITPTTLSRRTTLTKHTISHAISELEKAGMVKRSMNPDNYRTTFITLTKKGEEYADMVVATHRTLGHDVLSIFNEDELRELDNMLKRIRWHVLSDVVVKERQKSVLVDESSTLEL